MYYKNLKKTYSFNSYKSLAFADDNKENWVPKSNIAKNAKKGLDTLIALKTRTQAKTQPVSKPDIKTVSNNMNIIDDIVLDREKPFMSQSPKHSIPGPPNSTSRIINQSDLNYMTLSGIKSIPLYPIPTSTAQTTPRANSDTLFDIDYPIESSSLNSDSSNDSHFSSLKKPNITDTYDSCNNYPLQQNKSPVNDITSPGDTIEYTLVDIDNSKLLTKNETDKFIHITDDTQKDLNIDEDDCIVPESTMDSTNHEEIDTSLIKTQNQQVKSSVESNIDNSHSDLHVAELQCIHYLRDPESGKAFHSNEPWVLFREPLSPEDIIQGKVGNCWFITVASLLATKPELVKRLFFDKEVHEIGIVRIQLCLGGLWTLIALDSYFPVSLPREGRLDDKSDRIIISQGGRPVFTSASRHQLWPLYLEKAAAKVFGSYGALEAGTIAEGMALLTGEPVTNINIFHSTTSEDVMKKLINMNKEINQLDDHRLSIDIDRTSEELLWVQLQSALDTESLVGGTCGTHSQVLSQVLISLGLQNFHAYSILGVTEIYPEQISFINGSILAKESVSSEPLPQLLSEDRYKELISSSLGHDKFVSSASKSTFERDTYLRVIKLRNPAGRNANKRYTGPFGASSPLWTKEFEKLIGPKPTHLGEFYMLWTEFIRVFNTIVICNTATSNYSTITQTLLPSAQHFGSCSLVQVATPGEVSLVVWQEFSIARNINEKSSLDLGFIVLKISGSIPNINREDQSENPISLDFSPDLYSLSDYTVEHIVPRSTSTFRNCSLYLKEGLYLVVPISTKLILLDEIPRRSVLRTRSNTEVLVSAVRLKKSDYVSILQKFIRSTDHQVNSSLISSNQLVKIDIYRDEVGFAVLGCNNSKTVQAVVAVYLSSSNKDISDSLWGSSFADTIIGKISPGSSKILFSGLYKSNGLGVTISTEVLFTEGHTQNPIADDFLTPQGPLQIEIQHKT